MIIAEIGINHEGNLSKAKTMIDKAAKSGADIAKFQWYRPEEILGKDNPNLAEAKKAQFNLKQHLELRNHCEKAAVEWLVSAFHADQVKPLVEAGMKRFKIASRAALDDALLDEMAKAGLPVIVSTGLCDAARIQKISKMFKDKTFLYCICRYPAPANLFDFSRMTGLVAYGKFGFSSHCPDIEPSLKALRLGASVIEHHVVLDQKQKGCDVSSSITFGELETLCKEDVSLMRVSEPEGVEWLRAQRNRPELYRYFRQDAPISPAHQKTWWATNKHQVRLFIIEKRGKRVGYAGFNPFAPSAGRAEFGLFILPEFEGKGYGSAALRRLLSVGFSEYRLSTIYSDCLEYPGENRFGFYKRFGFEAFPREHQNIRYPKQGKMITSTKFFMTKDMWGNDGKDLIGQLEPEREKTTV